VLVEQPRDLLAAGRQGEEAVVVGRARKASDALVLTQIDGQNEVGGGGGGCRRLRASHCDPQQMQQTEACFARAELTD
jgi:hypothetical protein